MSTLKLENIKHENSSTNNMVMDSDGSVSITGKLTVQNDQDITGTIVHNPSGSGNKYLSLNTSSSGDGHILFKRAGTNKYQISSDTNGHLMTWSYAKNGTAHRINADGSVITPYQPAFLAYGSASYVNRGFGVPIDYSSTTYNEGNHYSTSTYRFTAPHAGLYHFAAGAIAHVSSTGSGGIMICHNGANSARSYQETGSRSRNCSVTLKLAANDLVDVRLEGGGGADYYYLSAGYGYFSGYLVG